MPGRLEGWPRQLAVSSRQAGMRGLRKGEGQQGGLRWGIGALDARDRLSLGLCLSRQPTRGLGAAAGLCGQCPQSCGAGADCSPFRRGVRTAALTGPQGPGCRDHRPQQPLVLPSRPALCPSH